MTSHAKKAVAAVPPKRLDPALWKQARVDWEGDPDMTFASIAARLGVSPPTVTMRAKRELWVKGAFVDIERINHTPMQMVETAVHALMRACNQTRDMPTAVKAAGMLLERVLGRVVAEAQPLMTPENRPDNADLIALITAGRFGYREAPEALEAPNVSQPPDPPQTAPSSPLAAFPRPPSDQPLPPGRAPLRVVEPEPPRFWESPSKPAA